MGSASCMTVGATLDAAGEPVELAPPPKPPWPPRISIIHGPGKVLAVKAQAVTGGWVALYVAGRLHSTLGLNTLKGMSGFAELDISVSDGEVVRMIGHADAGSGVVSCMVRFTD